MEETKTSHDYKTMINMNRPMYFKGGYSITQIIVAFVCILFPILIFGGWGLLAIWPVLKISGMIAKQNKKGYPDILDSWEISRKSPKYVFDEGDVYSSLKIKKIK